MIVSTLAAALLLAQAPPSGQAVPPDRAAPPASAPAAPAPAQPDPSAAPPQASGRTDAQQPGTPPQPPASGKAPRATQDDQAREAQAQADREYRARIDALQGEVDALREDVQAAQGALQDERDRSDALEQRLADQEDALEAAARSPVQRQADLGDAMSGMDAALGSLTAGSPDGVDQALVDTATALARARAQAGQFGATQEATSAAAGEQLIAGAREALSRSDLYQARVLLGRAALVASQARALAGEAAAGQGGPPPPPPAQMGTASGY